MATGVNMPVVMVGFNHEDEKYKCCCGCCHVKCGTLTLGILSFIGGAIMLVSSLYNIFVVDAACERRSAYRDLDSVCSAATVVISIRVVYGVILIFVCSCLFHGVRRQKPKFLIPYMVWQVSYFLLMLAIEIVLLAMGAEKLKLVITGRSHESLGYHDHEKKANVVEIISYTVAIAIQFLFFIWFFTVVYKCYKYLKDCAAQAPGTGGVAYVAAPTTTGGAAPYPGQQQGYPMEKGYHPPQQHGYPQPGYPPQQGYPQQGYPPQQGAYPQLPQPYADAPPAYPTGEAYHEKDDIPYAS